MLPHGLMAMMLMVVVSPAWGHDLRLAFLEAVEQQEDTWQIAIRVPVMGGQAWPLDIELPPTCRDLEEITSRRLTSGDMAVQRVVRCDHGSHNIAVTGIESGVVDVLVRLEGHDGHSSVQVVTGADGSFLLEVGGLSLLARVQLGLEHILTGYDHLAFVAGMVLLLQQLQRILLAVTAFTLAHSVTLSLASLGFVDLPEPPVEAVIALSIVYLAVEIVNARSGSGKDLPVGRVWTAALGFGLLHGFGFAGALRGAGIPESELPVTLLLFNLGIEIGQIAFVLALVCALAVADRILVIRGSTADNPSVRLHVVIAYGLGSVASFWTIERLSAFA